MRDTPKKTRIRPDIFRAALALRHEFGLSEEAELRLADTLPSFRPERFEMPYDDGAALALERPFGTELRAAMVGKSIMPADQIIAFDTVTYELAGMIEYFDRHGRAQADALFARGAKRPDNNILIGRPRVEPISPDDILPPLREALACLYQDMTGRKPSKKDYRKTKGRTHKIAVQQSPAHFIRAALCSVGWAYTDAQIARNYRNLLSIPWRLADYTGR